MEKVCSIERSTFLINKKSVLRQEWRKIKEKEPCRPGISGHKITLTAQSYSKISYAGLTSFVSLLSLST
jgi:hypothetical protein